MPGSNGWLVRGLWRSKLPECLPGGACIRHLHCCGCFSNSAKRGAGCVQQQKRGGMPQRVPASPSHHPSRPHPSVMEGECDSVHLEPFVHQVGGHYSMLRFDETSICKPLSSRELHFYETMPTEMAGYVPRYRGVVEVTFQEQSDGRVTMIAERPPASTRRRKKNLPPSDSPTSSGEGAQSDSDGEHAMANECCSMSSHRTRVVRCHHAPPPSVRPLDRLRSSGSGGGGLFEEAASEKTRSWQLNPWSAHCYKEQLARMRSASPLHTKPQKFLLLENLASHFELPCILDLKMGTRMHGDDASDDKRHNQIRKCEETTSAGIGMRMCGMQVYQADTGRFLCHNKYYGRQLSVTGLGETLRQFLPVRNAHSAWALPLIDCILHQLRALHATIARLHTFRFYSSSLLIMFDGADWCEQQPPGGDVVDSSATTSDSDKCRGRPRVYMIDFAHSTHHGFRGDRTMHSGPDSGYMFGLENLMQMLVDVRQEASGDE